MSVTSATALSTNPAAQTQSPSDLYLGNSSGSNGNYTLSGNGILSTQNEYVGEGGNGTFTQSGGTNTITGNGVYVGYRNASGNYTLSGIGSLTAPAEYIGGFGDDAGACIGTFTQTGGTNTITSNLTLAAGRGSSASYTLSNGTLAFLQQQTTAEYIGVEGNGTFTQTGGTNAGSNCNIYLGGSNGSNGFYSLSGNGTLKMNNETVGTTGNGTFSQTGGSNSVIALSLGNISGTSLGTYTLSGNGTLNASNETINPSTTFTQTGGTNTISNSLLFDGFGNSTSSYSLSNGSLTAAAEYLGANNGVFGSLTANSSFSQSGGTNTITTGTLFVGYDSGYRANYTLVGTGVLFAHAEAIGNSGSGNFTQFAGTNTVGTGGLLLANNANSTGSYTLAGTATLSAAAETIGANGTASFIQTGGFNTITTGGLTLANGSTSTASYNLTDPGYLSVTGNETLANAANATATFIQSGGTHIINAPSALTLAAHASASASYTLLGDGQLNAYAESIGNAGTATFTQSAGLNTIGKGGLSLGNGFGATGTYTLFGSAQLSSAGNETLAASGGTATFYQSGGINSIAAPSALIIGIGGSTATYNLTGGSLTTPTIQIYLGGRFSQSASTLSVNSLQLLGGAASFLNTTIELSSLTFTGSTNNWTGQVALANASLIVEATPLNKTTLLATLQNQAVYGLTHPAGIRNASLPLGAAIAVLDNANLGYTFFNGQPVDATSILILPALLGDTNLSGTVNITDLATILNNFGKTTSSWTDGNFDGQPAIDLTDLSDVLNNFGQSNPNASSSFILQPSTFPTPEPTTLTLLLFPTLLLSRRPRQK